MPPCRFCGSKCRVENFNSEHVEATLWICGNNEYFGGDCPDTKAYLFEQSWQDAMRSKDHSIVGDDVRERVARAVHAAFEPFGDYSYPWEHPMASREMFLALADAAITAIGSQSIEGRIEKIHAENAAASLAKDEERHG